jgi:hypothetical protein
MMVWQAKKAAELLAVATKLRVFAHETRDHAYFDKFRRGAEDLEIEAVGYAASDTIAAALRHERRVRRSIH